MGLTPQAWHKISQQNKELALKASRENSKEGPRYFLEVGRRIDSQEVKGEEKVLNFTTTGAIDPERPKAAMSFGYVTKEKFEISGGQIYPENILTIQVVPDSPNQ